MEEISGRVDKGSTSVFERSLVKGRMWGKRCGGEEKEWGWESEVN